MLPASRSMRGPVGRTTRATARSPKARETPSQGNSGRREVTGTRRVVGEDGGVVERAEVAFTALGLMVADVAAAVLHFAVARGSPGAQNAQIWRPFASPQKLSKPAQIGRISHARPRPTVTLRHMALVLSGTHVELRRRGILID